MGAPGQKRNRDATIAEQHCSGENKSVLAKMAPITEPGLHPRESVRSRLRTFTNFQVLALSTRADPNVGIRDFRSWTIFSIKRPCLTSACITEIPHGDPVRRVPAVTYQLFWRRIRQIRKLIGTTGYDDVRHA